MDNTKKLLLGFALLVLSLNPIFAYTISGTVTHGTYAGTALSGINVTCYNSTLTGTVTTASDGTYSINNLSGTAIDNGTYTCNASGTIGSVLYQNTSGLSVTIAGADKTNQNITCASSYSNTYTSNDVSPIAFDLVGTVLVALIGLMSIVGLVILWRWFKGRRIVGKL